SGRGCALHVARTARGRRTRGWAVGHLQSRGHALCAADGPSAICRRVHYRDHQTGANSRGRSSNKGSNVQIAYKYPGSNQTLSAIGAGSFRGSSLEDAGQAAGRALPERGEFAQRFAARGQVSRQQMTGPLHNAANHRVVLAYNVQLANVTFDSDEAA